MKIRLLAFASAAEALGAREQELELKEGATVEDLARRLQADCPPLAQLWSRLAVAVDGEIADGNPTLHEGAEVALLPPVSGGDEEPRVELQESPIRPERVLAGVAHPSRGASVLFLGSARDRHRGRPVARLRYDAYRPMALATLRRILEEVESTDPGLRLAVTHRLGPVEAAEVSVAIAAASPHRDAAFAACREVLERLKREVPIWKREEYADGGEVWREEEPLEKPGGKPGTRY